MIEAIFAGIQIGLFLGACIAAVLVVVLPAIVVSGLILDRLTAWVDR